MGRIKPRREARKLKKLKNTGRAGISAYDFELFLRMIRREKIKEAYDRALSALVLKGAVLTATDVQYRTLKSLRLQARKMGK